MPGNYSTSEIDTGYTWVDGSTIYKKTIAFGSLPNASTKSVAHNISNLNVMLRIEGIATNGNNIFPLPFPPGTDLNGTIQMYSNQTDIQCYCGGNRSTFSAYVTVYYTKTS